LNNKDITVAVAMSGGVDSSVTASLLQEQGYRLIGLTMRIKPDEVIGQPSAADDARRVAEKLDIPFHVADFRDLFQERVIDYFVQSYLAGRTPNPCVVCNQKLKFGALLDQARVLGADFIATGHYARVGFDPRHQRYTIRKAMDSRKDQSYVLYGLTQEQLSHTLFPLGDFTKLQIRDKARQLGLAVAEKPESQEICFIEDNDYRRFIRERVGARIKPGPMVDTAGKIIGQHLGLAYYTIGQRKGLGLALGYPAYVVAMDAARNTLVIGREESLSGRTLIAGSNNFVAIPQLDEPMAVTVKIRYKASEVPATITPLPEGKVRVDFQGEERAITPGQSVVYYLGDTVLGGGVIES